MKIVQMLFAGLFVVGVGLPSHATDEAVETMAHIVIGLDHVPTAAQKTALGSIADDDHQSADIRTIAGVLETFAHHASAADREKLTAIIDRKSADPSVKTLAGAILRIDHKPAPADVDALQKLLP